MNLGPRQGRGSAVACGYDIMKTVVFREKLLVVNNVMS